MTFNVQMNLKDSTLIYTGESDIFLNTLGCFCNVNCNCQRNLVKISNSEVELILTRVVQALHSSSANCLRRILRQIHFEKYKRL